MPTTEQEEHIKQGIEQLSLGLVYLDNAITQFTRGGLSGVPQRLNQLRIKVVSLKQIIKEIYSA